MLAQLAHFQEDFRIVDLDADEAASAASFEDLPHAAQLEAGLVLGIRDYFRKQGLPPGAVVGLSGGIDSAVTAHLAARALGRITGRVDVEDVLDRIFADFCIGK